MTAGRKGKLDQPELPNKKPSLDDDYIAGLETVDHREPDRDRNISPSPPTFQTNPSGTYVTKSLWWVIALIYFLEVFAGWGTTSYHPTALTLVSFGAQSRHLVLDHGQWYRLLTACFLHINFAHFAINGLFLSVAGFSVEAMFGPAWFFVLYILSGICGNLFSLYLFHTEGYSAGASGCIMGIMGAAIVVAFKLGYGTTKNWILKRIAVPFLLTLIPLPGVDWAAHLGGACFGLVLSIFLFVTWRPGAQLPRFQPLAKVLAFVCLGFLIWAFSIPVGNYHHNGELTKLVWLGDQRMNEDARVAQSAKLAKEFPHDPRILSYRSMAFEKAGDLKDASAELKKALDEKELMTFYYGATSNDLISHYNFEDDLQARLAILLAKQGKRNEAKEIAKSLCGGDAAQGIKNDLVKYKLCN